MPRRLFPLLVLAVLVGAGCADDVSPGVRIGDASIGHTEMLDEVGQWLGNPMAVDPSQAVASAPGAYPGELTRRVIAQRIDFELHNQEFARRGLSLDESARDQAIALVFGDPTVAEESLAAFTAAFADRFLDDIARQLVLQSELGEEEYGAWRQAAYRDTEIEVSSRYGTWDPALAQVVAPSEPQPAPTAGSPPAG